MAGDGSHGCRKIRAKAQMIAAYLLEVHDGDLEWDVDRIVVKGAPERLKMMTEIAYAAYNQAIPGLEPGLEAVSYYDPPNMAYPFGAYICVMEIDVDTGEHKIRQFYALDDCGTRINPMVIEGQVHGGLTEALAIAMGQEIDEDDLGNCKTGTLMAFSNAVHDASASSGGGRRTCRTITGGSGRSPTIWACTGNGSPRPAPVGRGTGRGDMDEWKTLRDELARTGYVASPDLAMALHLSIALGRPLLLEGAAASARPRCRARWRGRATRG